MINLFESSFRVIRGKKTISNPFTNFHDKEKFRSSTYESKVFFVCFQRSAENRKKKNCRGNNRTSENPLQLERFRWSDEKEDRVSVYDVR